MKTAVEDVIDVRQQISLPGLPKKMNRHVVIALNHLNKRREVLLAKAGELRKEVEEIDAAILALD